MEAASALRAAARRLDAQAARRAELAANADEQWSGGHRDAWFDNYDRLRSDTTELATRLRANASTIEAASDAAAYEQSLREQQRSDWLRLQEIRRQRETAESAGAERPAPNLVMGPVPALVRQHVGLL